MSETSMNRALTIIILLDHDIDVVNGCLNVSMSQKIIVSILFKGMVS